jgi:hypothetical protein
MVAHHWSGHNNATRFLPGGAARVAIDSIDARTANAREFELPHKTAIEQFEAGMPKKTAPKHRVVYWTGTVKDREKRDAAEVKCRSSRPRDSSSNTAGVDIQFQTREGDVVATAIMDWKEGDVAKRLSFVG